MIELRYYTNRRYIMVETDKLPQFLIEELIGFINGNEDYCKSNLLKNVNDRKKSS